MSTATTTIEELANREYKDGFFIDIETDSLPKGLSEDIIRNSPPRRRSPTGCWTGGSRRIVTG